MTTLTEDKSKAIPQRNDIEEKDKWNLKDLYENDLKWEDDYKKAQSLTGKAAGFAGKLAESSKLLYDCLETRSKLLLICGNLYQYAKLNQDIDNRVSKYQAMTERAAMLTTQVHTAYAFLEPELLQMDDDSLKKLSDEFPKTDVYDFYIKELIRSRAHIRSAEVEEVLAQSMMMARGPDNIFSMLDDADFKYPVIKDEKGEKVRLTKQRFAKFMESPEQQVRADAHNSFFSVYEGHLNGLGASLSASVHKDVFYSRARHYKSCLHYALDTGNIPTSVYHTLLNTTETDLSGINKWVELRKKILKLDNIYPYDMFNPLFPDRNYEVPYAEAIKEVLEAVSPLGEEYVASVGNAFNSRWVDVYETEGKSGGAYSWGNYSAHPFVMMNYNNTIDNMFTLAHELGHAMHSYFSNKTQPFPKSQYSIFVAEVASTLNEGLLLRHLLKKDDSKAQKLFLLNRHIDNTVGTFFHQVLYARFELMIHEIIEKGKALSPETMSDIWEQLTKNYYGPAITMDNFSKYKWSRIPHFYTSFYVYQYATSYAASQAILDKFIAGEKDIVEKYLELLSSGGSDYPIDQLKKCGVDMSTPEPVKATLKLFSEQVDEVEKLT